MPDEFPLVVPQAFLEHAMSAEERLEQLGFELPPAPKPAGLYKPVVVIDNLAFVSGHGPLKSDGTLITGRVGADLDQKAGAVAAKQTALAILASLRKHLGSLDKVQRVIKVLGMVNSAHDFYAHPAVINGCSEVFAQVFGQDEGVGARSAVGMAALPNNMAVEVEAIFEVEEGISGRF